jgi:Ribonuclease G/E
MLGAKLKADQWHGRGSLFEHFGVDEALELALTPSVAFPGGGKLIIETTAACTTVDVDAGPLAAADANNLAMVALAYELRLRNISGPIIVDLIPSKNRGSAVTRLKHFVADDPVPTRVVGLTPEGRIELNRRRLRPSLADLLLDPPGPGKPKLDAIAYSALRRCVRLGLSQNATRLTLHAHCEVITLLSGRLKPSLDEASSVLKISINLAPAKDKPQSWTDIEI